MPFRYERTRGTGTGITFPAWGQVTVEPGASHEHGNEGDSWQVATRSRDSWRRPCVSGDAVPRKVAEHRRGAAGRHVWLGRLRSREEALMDRQPHIAARAWCTHIGSYHAGRARLSTPPKGDNCRRRLKTDPLSTAHF